MMPETRGNPDHCCAQGGECEPGTEECYYLISIGLCDGSRKDKADRLVAVGWGVANETTPRKMQRFNIDISAATLEGIQNREFPIVYDFQGTDKPTATIKCHKNDGSVKIQWPKENKPVPAGNVNFRARARKANGDDISDKIQWFFSNETTPFETGGKFTKYLQPGTYKVIVKVVVGNDVKCVREVEFTVV